MCSDMRFILNIFGSKLLVWEVGQGGWLKVLGQYADEEVIGQGHNDKHWPLDKEEKVAEGWKGQ